MKKLILLLGVICYMLSLQAQVTVKWKNDLGWGAMNLYAWTEGSPDLLGEWPGTPVTAVDGWYSYTFDVSPVNVIFNDGGDNQTANITGVSSNTCYQINSETTEGDFGKLVNTTSVLSDCSGGTTTSGSVTVKWKNDLGWGAMNLYAWTEGSPDLLGEWPGTPVTAVDGWYSYTFDVSPVNVIFNDGGDNQSENIMGVSSNTCYQINSETVDGEFSAGHTVTVLSDCSGGEPLLPGTDITISMKKPDGWSNVYIWNWATGMTGNFVQPALVGDWYKYTFTNVSSINFLFVDADPGPAWPQDEDAATRLGRQSVDKSTATSVCCELGTADYTDGNSDWGKLPVNFVTCGETAVIQPKADAESVISGLGSINALFDGAAVIQLYSVSGALLTNTTAIGSFEQTGLAPGLYIVKINGQATKVAVK